MPKRLTDTEKWKKPFIRGLDGAYKLLWMYILDDCDHAGIWQVDLEVARIRIGENVDYDVALRNFNGNVVAISKFKWFIPDFIDFQYGALNPANRLHLSVINILKKNGLYKEKKGLVSPLEGPKDKDKDKNKNKDKDTAIDLPFQSDAFKHAWAKWVQYRVEIKKPYKSGISQQTALKELAAFPEAKAIQMINTSISNGWQGLIFNNDKQNGVGQPQLEIRASMPDKYHNG